MSLVTTRLGLEGMAMDPTGIARRTRFLTVLLCVGVAAGLSAIVALALLLRELSSPVVIRNALLASAAARPAFEWMPSSSPADFQLESGPVPMEMSRVVSNIDGDSNFAKAIGIARVLGARSGDGLPIQKDTVSAYRDIVQSHTGYCADFTQVFDGLAFAAHVPVREWGIGWRDFGKGHAFNEIFEPSLGKWILIDPFNSFYMVDASSRVPLSTLEVRDRLSAAAPPAGIEVVPIVEAKYPFTSANRALEYYRSGMHRLYLWWGNNVFSYDQSLAVRIGGNLSRTVEQLAGMSSGVHPRLRILATSANARYIAELQHVRTRVVLIGVTGLIAGLMLVIAVVGLWRVRRAARATP